MLAVSCRLVQAPGGSVTHKIWHTKWFGGGGGGGMENVFCCRRKKTQQLFLVVSFKSTKLVAICKAMHAAV